MSLTAWALLMTLAAEGPAKECSSELFRIARNKNANVVLYEAHRSPSGTLDPQEPVSASWLLLASSGLRESLNFIERSFAYGFKVRTVSPGGEYVMTLKALKSRTIRILSHNACPIALTDIGGQEGILQRIYVKTDERRLTPSVEYVELFGVQLVDGTPLYEKILPEQ